MMTTFFNIIKWFSKLTDANRVVTIMLGVIFFLGFFFFKQDKENRDSHMQMKQYYLKKLDTCENKTTLLSNQVSFWKDSLANEKLKNALKEIEAIRNIAKEVKKTEKNINIKTNQIKNKQKKILNTLRDEK